MSRSKHESMKIPFLKKDDYLTWRVKMLIFLEAIDNAYVDIINHGPSYPEKVVPMTTTIPELYIRKEKSELSDPENEVMLNDAKFRNILHNSLDDVMSNRMISCKTAKAIWDDLETQYLGTLAIKNNRRDVLIKEYEKFDVKPEETITDTYDRFLTLLNDLSLVGKEYDREDSNTKFLRALLEEGYTEASIIRHQYNLDQLSLDEVYRMLKTHYLEI
ncbi:uncharacterized protein LOC141674325 [Apium graveolens]|uniref:uncharacterized protein LOC141674325 n=1 Tax=Apium graveolens TaxID=4045 RepID=UPI003D78B9F8